jgi:hypothetical protein
MSVVRYESCSVWRTKTGQGTNVSQLPLQRSAAGHLSVFSSLDVRIGIFGLRMGVSRYYETV